MASKTTIEFEHYFSAAHHLPDSNGLTTKKCLNNHGHTYGVRVFLEATTLTDNFVVDFGTIKDTIDKLDHAQLIDNADTAWLGFYTTRNEKHVILPYPTTAENLSHYIFDLLNDALPKDTKVTEVWVAEGTQPGKVNWVKYSEVAE